VNLVYQVSLDLLVFPEKWEDPDSKVFKEYLEKWEDQDNQVQKDLQGQLDQLDPKED